MSRRVSIDHAEAIRRLFDALVELTSAEQAERLAALDDATLRQEIASLLDAYDRSDGTIASLDELRALLTHPAADADPHRLIGQRIRQYVIEAHLGGGGMGVVYRARDTRLGRDVALKFLPPHLSAHPEANERFMREARAASTLDHPSIGTIHEIAETADGQIFIAMAYYAGETLKAKIAREGPLPVDEALDYATQMAEGLCKAHEVGIVHRDVKPANVIVTEEGQVKVVDFGLARMTGQPELPRTGRAPSAVVDQSQLTRTGQTLGTAAYMSPEQARGEAVDARTDIWSLGAVLYEMLTGQRPFQDERLEAMIYSVLNEDPKPLREQRAKVPQALTSVIERCLEKDPHARFARCADLLAELNALRRTDASAPPSWRGLLRQPRFAIPTVLAVAVLGFFAVRFYQASANAQWARSALLPEIEQLIGDQEFSQAFRLAQRAQRYLPDDPLLQERMQSISVPVSIETTPAGAAVYWREYLSEDADWEYLGRTPLDSVSKPIGYFRWRVVKDGHEPVEAAFGGWWADDIDIRLHPQEAVPAGMVHVPGGPFRLWSAEPVELQEYWIDKYEVTNAAYQVFVDAGGYQNKAYWKHPFTEQGQTLSWDEAMALFVDQTGQPGPSTWALGSYPEGQADYPVQGVSWYEAAAYAAFAGKSLLTIYHWYQAAEGRSSIYSDIVILSNFEGDGPAPVGQFPGVGGFGTYDTAGNAREWAWNPAGDGRYILGGAWNEPHYNPTATDRLMPFDRSATNGFRCAKYTADLSPMLTGAVDPVSFSRNLTWEAPVRDEIFQVYKSYFAYDSTALNPEVESVDESMAHWRRETVTFDAAYGDERVIAHLYLPRDAAPPYQTIIYNPTAAAYRLTSSDNPAERSIIEFIPRTGRALVYPVYKGHHERGRRKPLSGAKAFRDRMIQQVKDFSRTMDYLQTRDDIDTGRLAYMGASTGARYGPVFTAVETRRLKTSVLLWGGLSDRRLPDPIAPINFAPRITIPVLMINGRHDAERPLETSQKPLFRLLGTPEEDKRHAVIDGGHVTPMNGVIRETLRWLDRYLGPVQPREESPLK